MPNENLKQFIDHLKSYKEITTKSDLAAFIKIMTEFLKKMDARNVNDLKAMKEFMASLSKKVETEANGGMETIKKDCMKMCNKMMTEHEKKMQAMDDKMDEMKDGAPGLDGKDADEEKIISTLTKRLPTKEDIANEIVSNGEKARDSLELLEGNNRLDKKAIRGLDELEKDIKDIKSRPVRGGGGVSAMGVRQAFKYIFHTEEPVGAINGANTAYTVSTDIWAIMSFTLNGEAVAELPNYTFSRRTITFSSALPAAYSGKDFEVKFIG